jgi:ribosomal protein S18 acetylase RimI-like enzyme
MILKKLSKAFNSKYIFYRRIAIILCELEEHNNQNFNLEQLNITVKRVKYIDKKIENKLKNALLRMDFRPLPFDIDNARHRLNNNCHFIIIEQNDELIGWSWHAVGSVYNPELEERIKLNDRDAFVFNTYIEKAYRNRGFHKIMLHEKIKSLREEGFKKEWGIVWEWNTPSLKSFTHMGWQIFGYYHYFRFFFLKIRYRAYSKKECSI